MVRENLIKVQQKIDEACERSGRDPKEVTLIAVSKTKPIEMIEEAIDAGKTQFGENKAQEAAKRAVSSPLLDVSINGAKDAIVNITGGPSMSLFEASEAFATITEAIGNDVNAIMGVASNDQLDDQIIVTIIATGFEEDQPEEEVVVTPKQTYAVHGNKTTTVVEDDDEDPLPGFIRNRKI